MAICVSRRERDRLMTAHRSFSASYLSVSAFLEVQSDFARNWSGKLGGGYSRDDTIPALMLSFLQPSGHFLKVRLSKVCRGLDPRSPIRIVNEYLKIRIGRPTVLKWFRQRREPLQQQHRRVAIADELGRRWPDRRGNHSGCFCGI